MKVARGATKSPVDVVERARGEGRRECGTDVDLRLDAYPRDTKQKTKSNVISNLTGKSVDLTWSSFTF